MILIEQEVNRILVEAESAAPTLRNLYELYKRHIGKFSMSFICRRAGIPSKGYLSFVMTGDRKLNEKYWVPVSEVFHLNPDQLEIMRLLFEREARPQKKLLIDQRLKVHKDRLH